jgi:hypothetical protein
VTRSPARRAIPWNAADIRSLEHLCADAVRLDAPVDAPTVGLLAPLRSSYANYAEAYQALARHPIHRWIKRKLPHALDLEQTISPVGRFRFVWMLAGCVRAAYVEAARTPECSPRTDRPRNVAYDAIKEVEAALGQGTINLTQDANEMLAGLLAQARLNLTRKRGRVSPNWMLEKLARGLQAEFSIADTRIIFDIAAVAGLACSDRTARNIVQDARAA